jgi:hypothetical protein
VQPHPRPEQEFFSQLNDASVNSVHQSAAYQATSYAVPSEVLHENVDFIDVHKLGFAFSFKIVTVLSLSNAQVMKEIKPTPAKNVMFRLSFGSGFDVYT